ncbi:MAG: ribonuclease HII [Bacteroidales bacterium]|nr:ribonuclease HII [Bacteroidales bacterium]
MLELHYNPNTIEAGCDEAGRGCLAGPVFAAAVILPEGYSNEQLNDSKQLTAKQRYALRDQIERDAVAWAVAEATNEEIDKMNILKASFHAMNLAVAKLVTKPEFLLIDGNRFYPESDIPYTCIVKGDAKFLPIAAASILAKTYRDDFMCRMHEQYPHYGWNSNMGYPTAKHYKAIEEYGITPLHRKSFRLEKQQLTLDFE